MKSPMSIKDSVCLEVGKGVIDRLCVKGHIKFELFGPDGVLKDVQEVDNLVTNLGFAMVANRISSSATVAVPGWMEVGTSTGSTAASSTLATYIAGSRTALSGSSASGAVLTMTCTFAAGTGTGTITEAGVFNIATENTAQMICYDDTLNITKSAADSLVATWTLTFSA